MIFSIINLLLKKERGKNIERGFASL